jgi:8-oxo-dGTP diphosphatase
LHLSSAHLLALSQRPPPPPGIATQDYWLAASCHNAEELAHAQAIGVDFVVLAPIQATQTHPDAKPLGWTHFSQLVAAVTLPVYALGGLSRDDLAQAQQAGGQGVAAIRAFLTAPPIGVQALKSDV